MTAIAIILAALALAAWLYLLFGRGGFWRLREREEDFAAEIEPGQWPRVVAVVPARDEAEVIGASIGSLLRQAYPGPFSVILVDDQSTDGTAAAARTEAAAAGAADRLTILPGADLPAGWTGKLWAMRNGLAAANTQAEPAEFVLFTDADIAYEPEVLRDLVAIAAARGDVLLSLMVKLRCASPAETMLVPAFVFFFRMLYPFAWVNDPRHATAAAAGGCMLVRRAALNRAGGFEMIRDALIDDCALGALLKRQGPVWLGLTDRVHSVRPYPALADIRRMVARSAYAQLGYSPWRLAGTIAAMLIVYFAPPVLALAASGVAQILAALAWGAMALAFAPTARFYRVNPLWGVLLPVIALLYVAFTLDSAWQHRRGRGGAWKGRFQAAASRRTQ